MRRFIVLFLLILVLPLGLSAQADRHDVRKGNRSFRKGQFAEADVDYRKAKLKDSLSIAANYNLAGAMYRQENYEEAGSTLDGMAQIVGGTRYEADYWFNKGDVAIAKQDWQGAMDAFKKSLLLRPDDMAAKENYAYAKLMKKDEEENQDQDQNQDGGGGGDSDQNQDQQDENQDQNQNQNNQDQQQQQQQDQEQEAQISPQQAQQMLQAIQAKEQETQDKVDEKKAAVLQARQREKNW